MLGQWVGLRSKLVGWKDRMKQVSAEHKLRELMSQSVCVCAMLSVCVKHLGLTRNVWGGGQLMVVIENTRHFQQQQLMQMQSQMQNM